MRMDRTPFEGFLVGFIVLTLFMVANYGLDFLLIKEGNYIGPSAIYGFPTLFALIYAMIVLIMYELVTRRSAFQSVIYPLFGYFYLDTIVQVRSSSLTQLLSNPDFIILALIFFFLLNFHWLRLQALEGIIKVMRISFDFTFYFDVKRIFMFFTVSAPVYYFFIMPLSSPVSLFLPLTLYLASWKRKLKY